MIGVWLTLSSRACRPLGIQIIFSSRTTLRKSLMEVKERPGMMEVKGVVYFIPCAECSANYIGETGGTQKVRMAEHRRAVENKDHKNGIAMHVQRLYTASIDRKQGSL